MFGVVIAAFEVWNHQTNETEKATTDLEDYKRRNNSPIVELSFFHKGSLAQEDLEFHLCALTPAYSVQIQPIVMPKSTAIFPEITKMSFAEWHQIKPTIEPVNDPKYRHDFIVMLHNQPIEFIKAHQTPESTELPEPIVAIPVDITYSNQTGTEWFITKMEILFDFNPLRDYVDTRLIERSSLPGKPSKLQTSKVN